MREIYVKFTVDWPEYEEICDELLLIDLELEENLKTGVKFELIKPPEVLKENKKQEGCKEWKKI